MTVDTALSNIERQEMLLRFVQQQTRATVNELATHFGVSVATVRRDLEALDEKGVITRFHGGAMVIQQAPPEQPVLQRGVEQANEKHAVLSSKHDTLTTRHQALLDQHAALSHQLQQDTQQLLLEHQDLP